MMCQSNIYLNGTYKRLNDYHQYSLGSGEMTRLAEFIATCAMSRQPSRVHIGNGELFLKFGSETGTATVQDDSSLCFVSNSVDLSSLAEALLDMARNSDPEMKDLVHIHLEPVFLSSTLGTGVDDIVIERIDEE